MDSTTKNHHKAIAILICLIVHSMLIVTILVIEMSDPQHEPIIMIADMQQEENRQENTSLQPMPQEEWVAMSGGIPTMQQAALPTKAATQDNPPLSQSEPQADAIESASHESPQEADQKAAEDTAVAQENLIEKSLEEVLELATQFLEEREPQKEEKQEVRKEKKDTPQDLTPKQQITLAQIAQGFVTQLQQDPSGGAMNVDSDKQGQASMSQLQQLHYCQKIIGCIVNSYKINRFNAPSIQQENRLCIHMALKQDGSIHTLRLVQSSGNSLLDQFVLATFKDASSSFPPLPQTFKQVPYHLPFFNIDRIESLHTTQGWYIDSRHS